MNKSKPFARKFSARKPERGFMMLEVVISGAILVIGLVALLAVFSLSVAATQSAQEDMIAKQVASEAMESLFTARNTSQVTWAQIQNVVDGGIFTNGPQVLLDPGLDGLVGTADDTPDPDPKCPGPARCLKTPGPDGMLGTSDDIYLPLNRFTREIKIVPVPSPTGGNNPFLRQVTVTINYTTPQFQQIQKTYVMSAYISQFR